MVSASRRIRVACLLVSSALLTLPASAGAEVPSIVVSPFLVPTSIARAGSTVSVITHDQIEHSNAGSVAELLRSVPGLTVTENGGPGSTTSVMLRGAGSEHTLVLIDGVRVNDPSSAGDTFDFATLSLDNVERIEVLRGPQSAVYGSDAMGGVINIITRKPTGTHVSVTGEGGSYGTRDGRISASTSGGPVTVSGSGLWYKTDGFSRVGNRDTGERDGSEKWAVNLRTLIDPGNAWSLEFGFNSDNLSADYDGFPAVDAAGYSAEDHLLNGYGRFSFNPPDWKLKNTFTVFGSETRRHYNENGPVTDYRGTDMGAEYRGEVPLPLGSLIFGARYEQEGSWERMPPAPVSFDTTRDLYAGYLIYQVPVGERLNLSFSGRYDGAFGGNGFGTARVTAVYDVPDLGGRVRGSIGTGAKRPTAFQLSLNPALTSEKSIGGDIGWEQTLRGGRVHYSVTAFANSFRDLIDFVGVWPGGNYQNVDRADTAGVEIAGSAEIVPAVLSGTLSYTYLYTHDRSQPSGVPLARRPWNSAKASLTYSGVENLSVTASATFVGFRFDDASGAVGMPPYVVVGLAAKYKINDHLAAFGRIDNLFNASYQEVKGYNTPGFSVYGGLTWAH